MAQDVAREIQEENAREFAAAKPIVRAAAAFAIYLFAPGFKLTGMSVEDCYRQADLFIARLEADIKHTEEAR